MIQSKLIRIFYCIGMALAASVFFESPLAADDIKKPPEASDSHQAINADSYFRLQVVSTTSDADKHLVTFNDCPSKIGKADLDNLLHHSLVRRLLGSESHAALTFVLTQPNVTPQVKLAPGTFDYSTGIGAIDIECKAAVDIFDQDAPYLSPLFYVRRYHDDQIVISGELVQTDKSFNSTAIQQTDKILGSIKAIASIPAPYLALGGGNFIPTELLPQSSGDEVDSIALSVRQSFDSNNKEQFTLPVPWTFQYTAPGADSDGNQRTISVIASLIPVPSMLAGPDSDNKWHDYTVLNSSLSIPQNCGPTGPIVNVAAFLTCYLGSDLNAYKSAAPSGTAPNLVMGELNSDCVRVREDITNLGVTATDGALMLWAEIQQNPNYRVNQVVFDNMSCLDAMWNTLKSAGLEPKQPAPQPKVAPDLGDMESTVDTGNHMVLFMKTANLALRRQQAQNLFTYPVAFHDATSSWLQQPDLTGPATDVAISGVDTWTAMLSNRPELLQHVGCFTYFPASQLAKDTSGLAASIPGPAGSKMLAIGQIPGATGDMGEFLIVFTFGPMSGAAAKIDDIYVTATPSTLVAQNMKAQWTQGCGTDTEWMPPIIFGAH